MYIVITPKQPFKKKKSNKSLQIGRISEGILHYIYEYIISYTHITYIFHICFRFPTCFTSSLCHHQQSIYVEFIHVV